MYSINIYFPHYPCPIYCVHFPGPGTPYSNLACLPPPPTPNACPVLPIHSFTPPKTIFAMPTPFFSAAAAPPSPLLPEPNPILRVAPPGFAELGNTFSPALKLTNSENGTNHTQMPKNALISVKLGNRTEKCGFPPEV